MPALLKLALLVAVSGGAAGVTALVTRPSLGGWCYLAGVMAFLAVGALFDAIDVWLSISPRHRLDGGPAPQATPPVRRSDSAARVHSPPRGTLR